MATDSQPILSQGIVTLDQNLDFTYLSLSTDKEIYDFNKIFWEEHREDFTNPYIQDYSHCRIIHWQELNYEKAREQITKEN